MDKSTIAKIMVDSKKRVATIRGETAHFDVDIPQAATTISNLIQGKDIEKVYHIWLKQTKRSGSVLVGSSIKEFFEFYKNYGKTNSMA